eukprot:2879847-Prorocentrum_lima.AAC.1
MLNKEFHREHPRSRTAVEIMEERNSSLRSRMEEMILRTQESRDHEHQQVVRALEETAQLHHDVMLKGYN